MAETALERFKTEQALKKERERVEAKEGEVKNLDQFQQSFLEALEDFATIATQQDVDLFNQKYSVNLVLPQEA